MKIIKLVDNLYIYHLVRNRVPPEGDSYITSLVGGSTEESQLAIILGSAEFYTVAQTWPGTTGPTADERFIQALYLKFLGRISSDQEEIDWIALIPSIGRTGVSQSILEALERRKYFVATYYVLYLARAGSQPEIDGWAGTTLKEHEIRYKFLASKEYYDRVITL